MTVIGLLSAENNHHEHFYEGQTSECVCESGHLDIITLSPTTYQYTSKFIQYGNLFLKLKPLRLQK